MKMSQAFPSRYLKASDLQGRTVPVTIDRVEMEEIGEQKEQKPVLFFSGKDKGVVLNKTNGSVIAAAYGDDSDGWRGRPLEMYAEKVRFQGSLVDAIRVRVPAPAALPEDDINF